MVFSEKIMVLINEKGITQSQFIKDLNLSSSAVQNWRRQGSRPRPETMKMIAEYFMVDRHSLENDSMPLARLSAEDMDILSENCHKSPALNQRISAMESEYVITEEMIARFSNLLDAKFTFLINTSEKEYNPAVHALNDRKDVDLNGIYDICELADSYASDDLSKNIMTQISRIIMYRVKTYLPDYKDKAKDDYYYWRDVLHINYDKVKYLLFQPTANAGMNYGFNLSELLRIRRITGISLKFLITGIGEPFPDETVNA
ncbi:MAG: helix-turn-helix transcriptional regulator [Oscillospiraceae bacterium]|nr:helix-turn-helix transcriptional regulator [Oscillospiraceae bacterium]